MVLALQSCDIRVKAWLNLAVRLESDSGVIRRGGNVEA